MPCATDDVDSEERGREPHAAADAALPRLVGEPLAVVVDGAGVHERADADLAEAERRRQRHAQLERSGDE